MITIDLSNLRTKNEVLQTFGRIFDFPGSANFEWGMNYDALNDCLRYLDTGGVSGTSQIFSFPLEIKITNYGDFQKHDAQGFKMLKEILNDTTESFLRRGKSLKVYWIL